MRFAKLIIVVICWLLVVDYIISLTISSTLEDFAASTRRANYHSCFASKGNDLDGLASSINQSIVDYIVDHQLTRFPDSVW